jgi:peptidoglycan/LPS O-acetylase OafA/YrhL
MLSHYANDNGLARYLGNGTGQYAGVLLFFALSGYLMGHLYREQPFTGANVLDFGLRRVARIVPLYLLVTVTAFLVLRYTGFTVAGQFGPRALASALMFWDAIGVFWTVPVEVQFYLVFPLLWFASSRSGGAWFVWPLIAALLLMAFGQVRFPVLLNYGAAFFVGVILAGVRVNVSRRAGDAAFLAVLAVFLFLMPGVWRALGLKAPEIWSSPLHVGVVAMLVWTATVSPLAEKVFGNPVARFFGEISFSLYLWHLFVLLLLEKTFLRDDRVLLAVAFFAITTVIAYVSYRYYERPLRRWIARASPTSIAGPKRVIASSTEAQ